MRSLSIRPLALPVVFALALAPLAGCGGAGGMVSLIDHGDANGYAYIPARTATGVGPRQAGVTISAVPLTPEQQAERELAPARGANVRADTGQAFIVTDTGAYHLKGLPHGTRTLAFSDDAGHLGSVSIVVARGKTTSGLVPSVTPSSDPGCIIGYLLRDSGPKTAEGGGIFHGAPSYDPNLEPASGATVTAGAYSAVTGPDGYFEMHPVVPGTYTVTTAGRAVGVSITVEGGSCAVVQDVSGMEETGVVVGRVLRVEGLSGDKLALVGMEPSDSISGAPEAGALVLLDTGHMVATDASGAFRMVGAPAGYHLGLAFTEDGAAEALDAWAEVQVEAGMERSMRYFPESRMGSIVVETGSDALAIEVGDSVCLAADAYDPESNQIWDFTSFTWASANPAVLAVDFDGEVRGLTPGATTVTASYGGVSSAPFTVTVGAPGTVARRGGVLTYWSDDAIATMTGDGLDRELWFDGFEHRFTHVSVPALSPDGTMMVFAGERAGDDADLYLYDLDSDETTRLTNTPAAYEFAPAWAPGGSGFYYDLDGDLYLWDLAAGVASQVTDTPSVYEIAPFPSPDGAMLAYTEILDAEIAARRRGVRARQEEDGYECVVGVLVLGSGTETVVSPDDGNSYGFAEWSPDGLRLTYEDLTGGRIVTGSPEGGAVTPIATSGHGQTYFEPTFSPGSDWVAFSVHDAATDAYRVEVVRATGADQVRIGRPSWDAYYPSWSDPPW